MTYNKYFSAVKNCNSVSKKYKKPRKIGKKAQKLIKKCRTWTFLKWNRNFLFQETEQELSDLLLEPKGGEDATDSAFAFIENLTNHQQAEFYETVDAGDSDKKQFISSLTRIFPILLNTKVHSNKIKKNKSSD